MTPVPTETVTYSQSIHGSGIIPVNRIHPIYWCAIPPLTGFALSNLEVKVSSLEQDSIPFNRAGMYKVEGHIISNTQPLSSSLSQATPEEIIDDYVHKISAPDFDATDAGISDDELFQSISETIGVGSQTNEPGDGRSLGAYGEGLVFSHPAVYDQARQLNLGSTKVYEYSSTLGIPYGKAIPIDENRVLFADEFNVSLNMMKSGGQYNIFLLMVNIPELGATASANIQQPIAPWDNWPDMIQDFAKAPLEWADSMDETDLSGRSAFYKEMIRWKRWYTVGDDSWQNSDMRFWMRGSAVLTTPFYLYKKHI